MFKVLLVIWLLENHSCKSHSLKIVLAFFLTSCTCSQHVSGHSFENG